MPPTAEVKTDQEAVPINDSNPVNPTEPLSNQPSLSTPAKPKPSPAEKPSRTPGVMGAPRKDGLPMGTKTAEDQKIPTPSPPFRRYWSEAPNPQQRPQHALRWLGELPKWVNDRLLYYVYRQWPILRPVEEEIDDKGQKVKKDNNYIDKLDGPPATTTDLLDKYGAGDYWICVSDDVVDKRIIVDIYIRENFRDLRAHPPTDRRIDNAENVEIDDPANRMYVAFLRANGKLPEQTKGATAVAEANAVTSVTGLLGEVVRDAIKRPKDDHGSGAAEALKVVASAAVTGQEIIRDSIRDSMKRSDEMRTATPDPLDTFSKVAGIIKESRSGNGGDGSGMVGQFMEMFKITLGVQNDRIAFAEKVAMEANTKSNNPATTTEGAGGMGLGGITNLAKQMNDLKEVFGGDAGGPWWKDPSALTAVLQGAGMVLGNAVALYQTHVRSQEVSKGMPGNTPMPQPATAAPMTQNHNPDAPGLTAGDNRGGGQDEGTDDEMTYVFFLRAITKPFLTHFDLDTEDSKGALFAEWLIDGYGKSTYDNLKTGGKEVLKMALSTFEPIAREIKGKDALLDKFVDEFMSMEEIRRKAEEEEEDQEEAQV